MEFFSSITYYFFYYLLAAQNERAIEIYLHFKDFDIKLNDFIQRIFVSNAFHYTLLLLHISTLIWVLYIFFILKNSVADIIAASLSVAHSFGFVVIYSFTSMLPSFSHALQLAKLFCHVKVEMTFPFFRGGSELTLCFSIKFVNFVEYFRISHIAFQQWNFVFSFSLNWIIYFIFQSIDSIYQNNNLVEIKHYSRNFFPELFSALHFTQLSFHFNHNLKVNVSQCIAHSAMAY